jgi:phosphoesterase RecJ-like protein
MSSATQIAEFIRSHDHFLIAAHVFPDGDNMGSTLAMSEGLRSLGKDVAMFIEGPIPRMYSWMPGADRIDLHLARALARLDGAVERPTLIVLDSGDLHRMGDEFDRWIEAQDGLAIANIDHHVSNALFGTVNWVDADYSSVGEMIYEVFLALGVAISPSIAQNLYVSVYTDTGRFSFSNTTERSLRYASEFVAAGAKPVKAYFGVYANRSFESFRLQTESFKTLTPFLDGKGLYFWVDRKMLKDTNTTLEDTEGLIDTMRTLRDFDIVVFFKEIDDSDVRVSVRAAPPISGGALMARFGGGGHARAAGCRILLPLKEAIEAFVKEAERAIRSGEVKENG